MYLVIPMSYFFFFKNYYIVVLYPNLYLYLYPYLYPYLCLCFLGWDPIQPINPKPNLVVTQLQC